MCQLKKSQRDWRPEELIVRTPGKKLPVVILQAVAQQQTEPPPLAPHWAPEP